MMGISELILLERRRAELCCRTTLSQKLGGISIKCIGRAAARYPNDQLVAQEENSDCLRWSRA